MIALIIYLSTTVFVPLILIILVIPLLILRYIFFDKNNLFLSKSELLAYLVIGFCCIFLFVLNLLYGPVVSNIQDKSIMGNIPYIILIFLSILMSKFLNIKDLKIISFLIVLEIFVGCLEYIAGVPTFFKNPTVISELADSDLLYQKKVFGFSHNSSGLAAKIVFLLSIIFMNVRISNNFNFLNKFLILFVFIGLFITFNRTAILACVVSFFFIFGFTLKNILAVFTPFILVIFSKWEVIYEQLTRGRNTVDYSGRDLIFSYFYNFWSENILFGNFGTKIWWNYGGSIWHAHNSYLEFLSSNGLLISLLFISSLILIYGKNFKIVIPILFYSIFQYGTLWGFTFYDLIFFSIINVYILNNKILNNSKVGMDFST